MKNTFGQSVCITVFGESHGESIGAVIDGLAPGIEVDTEFIDFQLSKRRPQGKTDTPRVENDNFQRNEIDFNHLPTNSRTCLILL